MQSVYDIKKQICEVGKQIFDKGYCAANDGNISVKVGDNEFYCTPTGVSKGNMTPDMIIKIDAQGNKIDGKLNPSSEIKMHMRVYRERPDVRSVVHAHPPVATAFAVCDIPLDKFILPEAILTVGTVPVCDYGTPSTMEIPDSLMPHIQSHDAFLLKNHGALTVGNSLTKAWFVMDEVEYFAKVSKLALEIGQMKIGGDAQELSCEQLEKLMELRVKMQIPGKHPGCKKCPNLGTSKCRCKDNLPASSCSCNSHKEVTGDMIAEITKKVMAELSK